MPDYLENQFESLYGKSFPCPLCDKELDIRIDKNDKPYVVCDDCKAQFFIRGEEGIEKLCQFVDRPW